MEALTTAVQSSPGTPALAKPTQRGTIWSWLSARSASAGGVDGARPKYVSSRLENTKGTSAVWDALVLRYRSPQLVFRCAEHVSHNAQTVINQHTIRSCR